MRHYLTRLATGLAAFVGCSFAAATAGACYSSAIPAPAVQHQTVVLVDLTTPLEPSVVASFRRAVEGVAKTPGQHLSIYSFAGMAAGQHLTEQYAATLEAPIADPKLVERLPIKAFRQSQACIKAAHEQTQRQVKAAMDAVLAPALAPRHFERSEILYSLREVVSLATPGISTRILIFSDALQHGSGISFYGLDKRPRLIDAKAELARLKPSMASSPRQPDAGPLKVLWWGVLAEPAPTASARTAYYDSDMLDGLQTFWSGVLKKNWGAADVQIGPTVKAPNTAFLPLAAAEALAAR